MKKKLIIIMLVICGFNFYAQAQIIYGYAISCGAGGVSSSLSIDYNIGRLLPATTNNSIFVNSAALISEQQNRKDEEKTSKIIITAFPNPAHDFVNLVITSKYPINKIKLTITDINGKLRKIDSFSINRKNYAKIIVDIFDLKTGIFYATVIINDVMKKNIKIVKIKN